MEAATYADYVRAIKGGRVPTAAERRANARYKTAWRKQKPDHYAKELRDKGAREKALRALAANHQSEFRRLLDAQRDQIEDVSA